MKYIATKLDDKEVIFVFPGEIAHDRMWQAMRAIRFNDYDWQNKLKLGELISAGFVSHGICAGRSETLGIESRGDLDTALLMEAGLFGYEASEQHIAELKSELETKQAIIDGLHSMAQSFGMETAAPRTDEKCKAHGGTGFRSECWICNMERPELPQVI